ncbi:MAG: hypothetical protein AAF609_02805 [Cyanobacteria bacterium P01_C01_bin.120]
MSIAVYQVVYLESEDARLYGELVQHVEERHICWVRPISLQLATSTAVPVEFLDVRNGPDVICADHVIQPVLDTDWLAILATMSTNKTECDYPKANQHLREFLAHLLTSKSGVNEPID